MIRLPDEAYRTGKYWSSSVQMVSGCTRVSSGCQNCWALAMEERFDKEGEPAFRGARMERLVAGKAGEVLAIWNDLFHEAVTFSEICQVLATCRARPDIDYLILTKRAERMCSVVNQVAEASSGGVLADNLWFGVSVENKAAAVARVPFLANTRAARRFVSVEPILGPVGLLPGLIGLDWVIVGSETGPKARVAAETNTWVMGVVEQCQAANVPVWVKGVSIFRRGRLATSQNPGEWHRSLRVRQVPGERSGNGQGRLIDVRDSGADLFNSGSEA